MRATVPDGIVAVVLVASSACSTASSVGGPTGEAPTASPVVIAPPAASTQDPAPVAQITVDAGNDSLALAGGPIEEVTGRLQTSKGMISIGKVLLSRDEVEAKLGPRWQTHLEHRVRARGRRRDRLLESLESIELCRSERQEPQGSVDCPVGADELEACVADCKQQSDACDAGSKGGKGMGLKRCGCAWISCKRSCQAQGEPLFACR